MLICAVYCYPRTERPHKINLSSSQKALYGINKPSNKIQGKDYPWNEIEYKFEVEDELVKLSYYQMQELKSSMMLKKKVLIISVTPH